MLPTPLLEGSVYISSVLRITLKGDKSDSQLSGERPVMYTISSSDSSACTITLAATPAASSSGTRSAGPSAGRNAGIC